MGSAGRGRDGIGIDRGVCAKPMGDFSTSKRFSMMNRLRNSTLLSSLGIRSFFMLRRILVTKWRSRYQRLVSSDLDK
ncbi:MAG: hypothetical protein TH68_09655 [Candidatus Synechococcus spongiarum 142]|uniref:Uncharacterized protein n=1 Tax=Candidatus Synechococcus spongiarum 142 TaxID=1608213 RepID=A0A6N3X2R8_9SYNE|nr:MAG: hypothetical protein TH68_09655 [Candidatus Synechococcus spongiarum 142]